MSKIDLNALKAEASLAHQTGRKMCLIHVDELVSLIVRAEELKKVQDMIPIRVGYCRPAELHSLIQSKRFFANLRRRKNDEFSIQMCALWLPSDAGNKLTNPVAVVAET